MLLEGGREMKTILSVQLANCIRMVLQITEGIDVGAGDNVLGPSIIRSLSLILPGSLQGIQCKPERMIHTFRHSFHHHRQLMDVDHARV